MSERDTIEALVAEMRAQVNDEKQIEIFAYIAKYRPATWDSEFGRYGDFVMIEGHVMLDLAALAAAIERRK